MKVSNKNIEENLDYFISKVTDKDVENVKRDFGSYFKLIDYYKDHYRLSDYNEAIKKIEETYIDIFFKNEEVKVYKGKIYKEHDATFSDVCLNDTLSRLTKEPSLIWEAYDKMNQQERFALFQRSDRNFSYTSNLEANINTITQDIGKRILIESNLTEHDYIKGFTVEQRKKYEDKFIELIQIVKGRFNQSIVNAYSRRIVGMATLLDNMDELSLSTNLYNNRMENAGLDGLKVEYEKNKRGNKPKFSAVKDLTDKEAVKKLSFDSMALITAYLTNRINKLYIDQTEVRFLINQLNNEDIDEVSNDELKKIIGKFRFLQKIQREVYTKNAIKARESTDEYYISEHSVFSEIDLNDIDIDKDMFKNYMDNLLSGRNNNFDENFTQVLYDGSILEGIYTHKDYAIKALVMRLMSKENEVVNWGYIPEIVNSRNSIERNRRMILLGVDMKGFNQPIRFHISNEELTKIVEGLTGKTKIPVYKGENDWILEKNGNPISTQAVVPFNKNARAQVKEYYQSVPAESFSRKYVEHLMWMVEPIYKPNRFVDEEVDLRTGEIFRVRAEKMIGD